MKLGAERKKILWLAGLMLTAVLVFYFNVFSGPGEPSYTAPPSRAAVTPAPATPDPGGRKAERRIASGRGAVGEFRPRQGVSDPKDRPNPSSIDPTLRLDLLAKVQGVELGPFGRNIFQTGAAPETRPLPAMPTNIGRIITNPAPQPPVTGPVTMVDTPLPPPQAPQMTFKYYGYKVSKADGHKFAFLLDGEDILIASENETFKQRYKVVKIGVSSITVEDTQFKQSQTLPLQENPAG